MKLTLSRQKYTEDGVLSLLLDENESVVACTLEHAYPTSSGTWGPKLPPGEYDCERGMHKLHDGVPFLTFEVMGVPGHSGILFHVGNFDADSEGCILVGESFSSNPTMVTNSRSAFGSFLKLTEGLDTFQLEVVA